MARRPTVAQNLSLEDDDQQDDVTQRAADDQPDDQQDTDTEQDADDDQQDDTTLRAADDQTDDQQDADTDQQDDAQPRRRAPAVDSAIEARLAAAEERAAAAERRAVEVEARFNARNAAPVETPEQEEARLALMTPAEIVRYNQKKVGEALTQHDQRMQVATLAASNASDKAVFEAKIARHPQWSKLGPEVEKRHSELVAKGQYPTRETVLTYVLGERAKALGEKAGREQNERRQRVDRQQTRPNAARSDVQADRRSGGRTPAERLENVLL